MPLAIAGAVVLAVEGVQARPEGEAGSTTSTLVPGVGFLGNEGSRGKRDL